MDSLENLATDSAEDNIKLKTNSTELQESGSNNRNKEPEDSVDRTTPVDWKPQKACYFCVDGKLLTVNERGEVVAEPGPVPAEPELANKVQYSFIKLNLRSMRCGMHKLETNIRPNVPISTFLF